MSVSQANGLRAKLARALEHLLDLDQRVAAYLDSEPLGIRRENSPDGRRQVFVLEQRKAPALELSVLVGEVAHQLRSAVEHVAHGLVVANGGQPTFKTAFPVHLTEPAQLRIDGGVGVEALARVADSQPYRAPNPREHPMHVLNRLWNIDKHRTLHLATLALRSSQIFVGSPDGTSLVGGQFQTAALRDDNVIGVFDFEAMPDPDTEVTASGQTFVALGEAGPWQADQPVTLLLEGLHQYVTLTLLPRFEPLL